MNNRLGVKIVSILLGIFAWGYVNLFIPPQIKRTVVSSVEYRNSPYLMKITPESPKVEIELQGNRRDFIVSGARRVEASVDLYNLRPGRAMLPVKVTASSGLSVVAVNPPQIEVSAIPLIRKEFDISVEIQGQTAEGYIAESPRISPEEIVLEGPEDLVKKVTACQVEIVLDQVKNSVSESRPVKIFFENDETNAGIRAIPEKVSVDVTVKQGYPTKLVPLAKPLFINKTPEGVKLESYSISPGEIALTGPSRLLDQISSINSKAFDLSKLRNNGTFTVKLELPSEKIKFVGSDSMAIAFQVGKATVLRQLSGLSFELRKAKGQHVAVSVASYALEMEGYVEDLEKVRDSQLKLILDITSMDAGKYDVPLTVPTGLPSNISVKKISPEKIQVEISELATPNPTIEVSSQTNDVSGQGSATLTPNLD
jgi:YbbR domain-containing protein